MTLGQSGDAPGTVVIGDPIDDTFDRNERHRSRRRLAARDPDAGGRAHLRAVVARQGPDGWHGARGPARPCGRGIRASLGLPPITGLYATIVPLLVYALVGLARFGFLAELLSAPVRYGYLNGIAVTILVSQLPKALGFSVDAGTLLGTLRDLVSGITDGETNRWAIGLAGTALAAIVGLRRFVPRVPGVLVAVIAGILATVAFGLADHGVRLVGDLPSGFPSPRLPDISWQSIGRLIGAAPGIAFIAFADTSVLARVYADKRGARATPTRNSSRLAWSTSQPACSRECR